MQAYMQIVEMCKNTIIGITVHTNISGFLEEVPFNRKPKKCK